MKTHIRTLLLSTVAVAALAAAGFTLNWTTKVHAQPAAPVAAVSVGMQTVSPKSVQIWSSFSGRVRPVNYAEIRPQVSGRIMEIRFRDGQTVNAGDVLFVIDPRPYEAAVARAEANLATAKTNAELAAFELKRATDLLKTQDVAQRVYDQRTNADSAAKAAIKVAEAELKVTKVDYDHAYIKAPITGRVSREEIPVGNLVQAGQAVLTSIVSNDGVYADFEVDEHTYISAVRARALTSETAQRIPVSLAVAGDDHAYNGTIWSFDNHIDTASGTIRARAKFKNEDGMLVPGMFVTVKLASDDVPQALLIPERAIGNDQSRKFVYVVGADNKVAYREVTLGQQTEGQRIVASGLKAGERVVVDGVQHVRPDVTVQSEPHAVGLAAN